MKHRWTPALFQLLDSHSSGQVSGHKRTIRAALDREWIEARHGWMEAPASRYHRRARATESLWGVVGYRLTDTGAIALANERHRRKTHSAALDKEASR